MENFDKIMEENRILFCCQRVIKFICRGGNIESQKNRIIRLSVKLMWIRYRIKKSVKNLNVISGFVDRKIKEEMIYRRLSAR